MTKGRWMTAARTGIVDVNRAGGACDAPAHGTGDVTPMQGEDTDQARRVVEAIRHRISGLPLAAVMPEQDRRVRDRNTIDRPFPVDVVYLDDVWSVLDAALTDDPNGGQA